MVDDMQKQKDDLGALERNLAKGRAVIERVRKGAAAHPNVDHHKIICWLEGEVIYELLKLAAAHLHAKGYVSSNAWLFVNQRIVAPRQIRLFHFSNLQTTCSPSVVPLVLLCGVLSVMIHEEGIYLR